MSVRRICWSLSRRSRLESSLKVGLALAVISLGVRTTLGQSGPRQTPLGWTICIHVEKFGRGIIRSLEQRLANSCQTPDGRRSPYRMANKLT
jgi:hypothetical protein